MASPEMKIEPLFIIFEKHLYDFDDDALAEQKVKVAEFVDKVVEDYLSFLTSKALTVPERWRPAIKEELVEQVEKMLLKKIYGCLSIQDYVKQEKRKKQIRRKRTQTKKKYQKLF